MVARVKRQTSAPRVRPRSEQARRAALAAARALLDEGGLGAVTMDAVAERAAVGKPTLYRSWPNRHALAMSVLMEGDPTPMAPDSMADASRDAPLSQLREQLRMIATRFASPTGRHITSILAASDPDTELSKAFRSHFVLARRREGKALLEAAVRKQILREDLRVEIVLDCLYGALFFRLLVGHAVLDGATVDAILDECLRGMAPLSRKRR
jgi:AcrR family transcriptional regulator